MALPPNPDASRISGLLFQNDQEDDQFTLSPRTPTSDAPSVAAPAQPAPVTGQPKILNNPQPQVNIPATSPLTPPVRQPDVNRAPPPAPRTSPATPQKTKVEPKKTATKPNVGQETPSSGVQGRSPSERYQDALGQAMGNLDRNNEERAEILSGISQIDQARNSFQSATIQNINDEQEQRRQFERLARQTAQSELDGIQAEIDKLGAREPGKIDPKGYFKNNTAGAISSLISVALNGLGNAFIAKGGGGQQNNFALDVFNKRIDEDISAQRDALDRADTQNKQQILLKQSSLARKAQEWGNIENAMKAERIEKKQEALDKLNADIQKFEGMKNTEQAKLLATQMNDQLTKEKLQLFQGISDEVRNEEKMQIERFDAGSRRIAALRPPGGNGMGGRIQVGDRVYLTDSHGNPVKEVLKDPQGNETGIGTISNSETIEQNRQRINPELNALQSYRRLYQHIPPETTARAGQNILSRSSDNISDVLGGSGTATTPEQSKFDYSLNELIDAESVASMQGQVELSQRERAIDAAPTAESVVRNRRALYEERFEKLQKQGVIPQGITFDQYMNEGLLKDAPDVKGNKK